ncbi:hypothetical protein BAE44_0019933 [Dichanthelium oligosanthes]|uniref:Uncharacterized protein n=1 Tax=Dichanthelium oligosanthes TaxID=888268 RepID=A0A1E5V1W8_9POAL|nr:hypothetical protein BAE44_0019933 [Dichanthelium oligosanthes]
MGGGSRSRPGERALLLALVALCSLLAQPQPCRASFFGGGREEKVPMTVVVPDYSPRPAPLGPSPSAAPAPVRGSDGGGGGDEDGTPRLPSERQRSPPSSSGHGGDAKAPAGAASADFISSSPAVPLPAGVTDSATVLPMPTPGQQQRRDDAGMAALQPQVRVVQLAVPLLMMMLSFRALWW